MRSRLLLGISVGWIPLAFLFDGVTVLVLPLRLGADATQLGLVSFVGLAAGAVLQPFAGRLSDRLRHRVDRRRFAVAAAVPAVVGVWLLVASTGVVAAVLSYVVIQLAASTVQASQQTLIPEHAPPDARGRAAGLKAAFDVGGAFICFLVLGAALASGDLVPGAVVTTLAVVVAVVATLALVPARVGVARPPDRALHLPPGLVALVLSRFLFLLGTYVTGRFLLMLVAQRLGIPAERAADETAGLLALLTLATGAAALAFGRISDRVSRRALMASGAAVGAFGVVALVPALGLAGLVVGGILMSVGTGAFVTANWAATTDLAPAQDAGLLMGLANLGTAVAAAVAGLAGPLIDGAGFAPTLTLAAIASAAAIVPLLRLPEPARRPVEISP